MLDASVISALAARIAAPVLRGRAEDLPRLLRELAEGHLAVLALLVLELHLAAVLLEGREHAERAGIAVLDERLDRRGDGLGVRVLEEAAEELQHAALRDVREQVRQLREREVARRQALERALHAERDLLEAVVREVFERDARGVTRFGLLGAENVDEEVHRLRPFELAEHRRDPHQAERALVLVV